MISKMRPVEDGGSRLAIVFNGSPLFTGAAESGESEIRRWIIENDWLEAVVALPDQLFYNTGISTYFWVLTNRKSPQRRGKVQLVDAREHWVKMRKSLGEKRKQISDDQIREITQVYASFTDGEQSKIFPNEAFGYQRITVERPLRARWEVNDETLAALMAAKPIAKFDDDQQAKLADALTRSADLIACDAAGARAAIADVLGGLGMNSKATLNAVVDALMLRDQTGAVVTDVKGAPVPDADLRDQENVPLPSGTAAFQADATDRLASGPYREAVEDYVEAEVLPFAPGAWIDHTKTKMGYEIPLTRHFYKYVPSRPLEEIDAEINMLEVEIQELLREVTE
jgi:type I restriction enzyme M protein